MNTKYREIKESEIATELQEYLKPEAKIKGIEIDNVDEDDLKYQLSKIRGKILDYIHQSRIEYDPYRPEKVDALYHLWAEITTDLIKHLNALLDDEETAPAVIGAITQISGGDSSYSFSDRPAQTQKTILKDAHKINLDEWVFKYTDQLQSHRQPAHLYRGDML